MPDFDVVFPESTEFEVTAQSQTVEYDVVPEDIVLVDVTIGAPGIPGPDGPPGPPGGAMLTGWWNYNSSTATPPGSGQIRTLGSGNPNIGDSATAYISHTTADGIAIQEGLPRPNDDEILVRDAQGNTWKAVVTSSTVTVAGVDGYSTIVGTITATTGQVKKNSRVQISLLQQPAPGPQGPPGPPGTPAQWTQMTQAAYTALPTKDPNTLYVIVG